MKVRKGKVRDPRAACSKQPRPPRGWEKGVSIGGSETAHDWECRTTTSGMRIKRREKHVGAGYTQGPNLLFCRASCLGTTVIAVCNSSSSFPVRVCLTSLLVFECCTVQSNLLIHTRRPVQGSRTGEVDQAKRRGDGQKEAVEHSPLPPRYSRTKGHVPVDRLFCLNLERG